MAKKFSSELLSDAHELATGMFSAGIMSKEEMEQFDRLCLSSENSDSSCVPDIVEDMDDADFEFLAQKLNVSSAFVIEIINRRIEVETIPGIFMESMANVFGVPTKYMDVYLASESEDRTGYSCASSADRPDTGRKMSFFEAVQSSDMTDSQRQELFLLQQSKANNGYTHPVQRQTA